MTAAPAIPRREIPAGLRRRGLRRTRYVDALGPVQGHWLWLREVLGDRGRASVRHRGRRLTVRLNTSDILVWYSVFRREDYGIELSPPPSTIIDVGAYTGLSAIYLAERYPGATILALEPDPSNFALLVRNAHPFPNIIPLDQALWHEDGRIELRDPGTGHWAFYVAPDDPEAAQRRAEVAAVCMRTLIERFELGRIDLLKMNAEGAEKEVFEHSEDWIERVEVIVAQLHDQFRPGCAAAFERATASFGRVIRNGATGLAVRRAPAEPAP